MQSALFVSLLENPQDALPVISTTVFVINCHFVWCLQAICSSSTRKILRPHVTHMSRCGSFLRSFIRAVFSLTTASQACELVFFSFNFQHPAF